MKVGDKVVINSTAIGAAKNFIGHSGTITSLSGRSAGFVKVETHPQNIFCLKTELDTVSKKVPHKHAEVIKAWADGAKIERRTAHGKWSEVDDPAWHACVEYRVKQAPVADKIFICEVRSVQGLSPAIYSSYQETVPVSYTGKPNVKMVFDGETGKLKGVEFIGPP